MRYKGLKYKNKITTKTVDIDDILMKNGFYWLIDSEIEEADIEIENKTLIWKSGYFYHGYWYYGIFKNGEFHGTWENGIFENGVFKGKWISGVSLSGV